jgi:outer membrane protein OmpA-like peptidoglycan-associated protein
VIKAMDRISSQHWAIRQVIGAGSIPSYYAFDLVNRETGRAHQLQVVGGGFPAGVGIGGRTASYTPFETSTAVSFADFDGVGVRLASANCGQLYGHPITWLTLWKGSAYLSDALAYVRINGGGFILPGGSYTHGVAAITYGSGVPLGQGPLQITPPRAAFTPDPRLAKWQTIPTESKVVIPEEVLFDYDKLEIKKDARQSLLLLADMLNNRNHLLVCIEGHTDSTYSSGYNKTLSEKRAGVVKKWLVKHNVYQASRFTVLGYGATRPVVPSQKPNGANSSEGRHKNRRVEVIFQSGLPQL